MRQGLELPIGEDCAFHFYLAETIQIGSRGGIEKVIHTPPQVLKEPKLLPKNWLSKLVNQVSKQQVML